VSTRRLELCPPPPEDPYVARALAAMKAEPAKQWTVSRLAQIACLSRAPFARRFRRALGIAPAAWLREHRLRLAQAALLSSDATLTAIAGEVGYATAFALAKAFRRRFGMAPGVFRRSRASIVLRAAA
jgi:transcriptional regulator GlxA family with amidase domain